MIYVSHYRIFHSFGQNLDKLTKLSNIGFSMELFKADFPQLFNTTVKFWLLAADWLLAINFK